MNNFEIGNCHRDEYDGVRDDRFHESELAVEGLYTLMMLHGDYVPLERQAAKCPVEVVDLQDLDSGRCEVTLKQLTRELEAIKQKRLIIQDGLWLPQPSRRLVFNGRPVREAFLHAYPEATDGEITAEDTTEADAAQERSRELVPAGPSEYYPHHRPL